MKKIWLCGLHACLAAINNPRRVCHRILVTEQLYDRFKDKGAQLATSKEIASLFKMDVPHQGVIMEVSCLPPADIKLLEKEGASLVIILDQLTDPRNVGAIMRTAAAFGAHGVLVQSCNSPKESAILAKAASGALETVPLISVTNISRALQWLKDNGYWIYGFNCNDGVDINSITFDKRSALVLGAENDGIRSLVNKHCDFSVQIPIQSVQSLNVSVTAALGMFSYGKSND